MGVASYGIVRRGAVALGSHFWLALAVVTTIGFAVRVWYALAVAGDAPLVGDGLEIHGIANAVADGRGFVTPIVPFGADPVPTAHKPPLYPLVLAAVSLLDGGYRAHHVATALIGAATIPVIALLARHLVGRPAGLIAGGLTAAYPVFVAADASLRSETLYVLLIALTLLAAYRAYDFPSAWRFAQLGVVIALAALTRSEALLLFVLLVPPLLARVEQGRALRLAVAGLAVAVVLAPWLIRCWTVFDQPVLISTNSGDLLAGANCDTTYSGALLGGWAFGCALGAGEFGENEAVVSNRLRERGLRYAEDHAGRLPVLLAARALRPWGLYRPGEQIELRVQGEGQRRKADWVGLVSFWALALIGPVGLVVMRRRGVPVFVLLAPIALVLLVSIGAYGVLRFRAPADVSVIVLAAVALDAGARRLACRRAVTDDAVHPAAM